MKKYNKLTKIFETELMDDLEDVRQKLLDAKIPFKENYKGIFIEDEDDVEAISALK